MPHPLHTTNVRPKPILIEDLYMVKNGGTRQILKVGNIEYKVYGTIRKEPNNFDAIYHCKLCDIERKKYVPKVIRIPGTSILVCSSCIQTMAEVLSESTYADCKRGRKENG